MFKGGEQCLTSYNLLKYCTESLVLMDSLQLIVLSVDWVLLENLYTVKSFAALTLRQYYYTV